MGLFGSKDKGSENGQGGSPPADRPPRPENASKFFKHAETSHATGNYEYAMQLWLNGLRQDWTSAEGLEHFLRSALAFASDGSRKAKGVSKETRSAISGDANRDVDRYVQALLSYGLKPSDASLAIRATESAARLGAKQAAQNLGRRALGLLESAPRKRKDDYVRLLEAFAVAGIYDLAEQSGSIASRLDPSDSQLSTRVKNMMAAKAAESIGTGDFRQNIRDVERQTRLEQGDRVTTTEETRERQLDEARAAFEADPSDKVMIDRYGRALVRAGGSKNELLAAAMYKKAYDRTGEFRFKQLADNILLGRARGSAAAAKRKADAAPGDDALRQHAEQQKRAADELEEATLREHIEAYPTDTELRLRLGELLHGLGRHADAIPMLQQAMNDTRIRARALATLGRSFLSLGGYESEAVEFLRLALDAETDADSDRGMAVRYDLMRAMLAKAEADNDLEVAEAADKVASEITRQNFGYRDIHDRRKAIKELIGRLRA